MTVSTAVRTRAVGWAPTGCPASGARLALGEAHAATGLRVRSVALVNCGTRPQTLHGYPDVRLLDDTGELLALTLARGARQITTGVHDPGPWRLTVAPGGTAAFPLVWRHTYDDTRRPPAVGVAAPAPGGPEHRLTGAAPFDLGSTARLGVTAWTEPVPGGAAAG